MLKLADLIDLKKIDLKKFKIHCATGKNPKPLDAFFDGSFREWQEDQNQKNFECDHVLSLIGLGGDRWLFAGVYQVHSVSKRNQKGKTRYVYATSEVPGLAHLTGRAVISFRRTFRASYLQGWKYIDQLVVDEILPRKMSVGEFPGYHAVLLSWSLLRTVVRESVASWKAALGSVAGVYVVVDTKNGKQYVGSAQGEGGIWRRWESYAKNGHAGNKELRDVLKTKGKSYADNFQFGIIEVCDIKARNEYVLEREAHWKNALCTREFGYNKN